ncbi:MAG: N-formylglutamate amidohydrolase [Cyclobacteriaceae bacterium]|nr:N-formylglutamate amidohydrolase [Cyclobacteriaceae bacterium]
MFNSVILSCEHAGNMVPDHYQYLFDQNPEVLKTHWGWDLGAWNLAQFLSTQLNVPLYGCHTTRLLIEANRSLDNSQLFSDYSSKLSNAEKAKLIEIIYHPYRIQVREFLNTAPKSVLHLSIHSFTPIWNGVERPVDIGILYDPDQTLEHTFSLHLKEALETCLPGMKIKLNEPYKGTDDGFTTELRKQFALNQYAGIELEVSQKYTTDLSTIQDKILASIQTVVK